MNTFEKIEIDINALKEFNPEAGNILHDQLSRAQNASWTRNELAEYLKIDNDVADKFYMNDDIQHAEIRAIQDAIIELFGE